MNKKEVAEFFDWFVQYNIDVVNNAPNYIDYRESKDDIINDTQNSFDESEFTTKRKLIIRSYTKEERKRRLKLIKQKVDHSNRVADGMVDACKFVNFNEKSKNEYIDLAWIIGILHDIARPLQMQETGTYIDNESYSKFKNIDINCHDDAGAKLLFDYGFIEEINVPQNLKYVLKESIRQHGKPKISENLTRYEDEEILNLLKTKTLNEIVENNETNEIEMLTYFYLKILRDIDKIDIYRQVINNEIPIVPEFIKYKALNPKTNEKDSYDAIATTFKIKARDIYEANGIDFNVDNKKLPDNDIVLIPIAKLDPSVVLIPQDIFDSFINNEMLPFRELQKRRDYNFLCATIVRLNFIWGINSPEVLKLIKKEDLLTKMLNNYPADYQKKMKFVFDSAGTILDNRINEMELKSTKQKRNY